MKKTLLVHCPLCAGTLEVDAASGKVTQHWRAEAAAGGGDVFARKAAAVKERERRAAETDAASIARRLEEDRERRVSAFDDKVKRAKKAIDEGERPTNPLDLD
ncbi:MAG: hypothetical protein HZA54_12720 [Planctomycetes bacterium]|nr:hypothetical protein [Planctomycetota bacterium]